MWFTDNEKLDIGRRVYTQEISKDQASPIIREQKNKAFTPGQILVRIFLKV